MEYDQIEPGLKRGLHGILKERTGAFLDFLDALKANPGNTLATIELVEQVKTRGKKQFMECQNEILGMIKNFLTTGEAPTGIDKRAAKVHSPDDRQVPA